MDAASTTVVFADASVLINLMHINRLDLLGILEGLSFVVPDAVVGEVTDEEQSRALDRAIVDGLVRREPSTEPVEIVLYGELKLVLGKGEAACLAMAQHRGCLVACDERGAFLREARRRLGEGRVLNTPGLLLLAIRQSKMTLAEADAAKESLETKRFKMKFGSFRDLLG